MFVITTDVCPSDMKTITNLHDQWIRNILSKIEKKDKIQERCLLSVLNDNSSNFTALLQSSGSVSMETQRLRAITYQVFRTLNDLNPNFMKEIFYRSPKQAHRKGNLYVHSQNAIKFENKSLRSLGTHIWSSRH